VVVVVGPPPGWSVVVVVVVDGLVEGLATIAKGDREVTVTQAYMPSMRVFLSTKALPSKWRPARRLTGVEVPSTIPSRSASTTTHTSAFVKMAPVAPSKTIAFKPSEVLVTKGDAIGPRRRENAVTDSVPGAVTSLRVTRVSSVRMIPR